VTSAMPPSIRRRMASRDRNPSTTAGPPDMS
jgi:hypothetical protein